MIEIVAIEVRALLLLFVITLIVELAVAYSFGYKKKNELLSVALINVITNPLANFILYRAGESQYWSTEEAITMIVIVEVLVVVAEWLLLRYALRGKATKMFVVSLVINASSLLIGLWILWRIG